MLTQHTSAVFGPAQRYLSIATHSQHVSRSCAATTATMTGSAKGLTLGLTCS